MKFWTEIPIDQYHGDERAITKSKLALFADCISPSRYKTEREQPKKKHFTIGQLFEDYIQRGAYDAVVKPETYINEKGEVKPWNGNATFCKEWVKDHEKQLVITAEEQALLTAMVAAFDGNSEAVKTQRDGVQQPTLKLDVFGVTIQARPDWYLPEIKTFRDLKTCESLEDFHSDILKYKYHWQAAICIDLAHGLTSRDIDYTFEFIAVDKQPFPECQIIQISSRDPEESIGYKLLDLARREMAPHIASLGECIRSGHWPKSPEVRLIKTPKWLQ